VGSATAVAVNFAVPLVGMLAGAVYSTDVLFGSVNVPPPFSVQVTPFPEESLATNAVTVID
jgi:hypothetical protein